MTLAPRENVGADAVGVRRLPSAHTLAKQPPARVFSAGIRSRANSEDLHAKRSKYFSCERMKRVGQPDFRNCVPEGHPIQSKI